MRRPFFVKFTFHFSLILYTLLLYFSLRDPQTLSRQPKSKIVNKDLKKVSPPFEGG
jgi:hypothetical protein